MCSGSEPFYECREREGEGGIILGHCTKQHPSVKKKKKMPLVTVTFLLRNTSGDSNRHLGTKTTWVGSRDWKRDKMKKKKNIHNWLLMEKLTLFSSVKVLYFLALNTILALHSCPLLPLAGSAWMYFITPRWSKTWHTHYPRA